MTTSKLTEEAISTFIEQALIEIDKVNPAIRVRELKVMPGLIEEYLLFIEQPTLGEKVDPAKYFCEMGFMQIMMLRAEREGNAQADTMQTKPGQNDATTRAMDALALLPLVTLCLAGSLLVSEEYSQEIKARLPMALTNEVFSRLMQNDGAEEKNDEAEAILNKTINTAALLYLDDMRRYHGAAELVALVSNMGDGLKAELPQAPVMEPLFKEVKHLVAVAFAQTVAPSFVPEVERILKADARKASAHSN